jgi:hypothetical protein
MNVGDQVVLLDDEPELDLPEGAAATVTAFREPDHIEFQLTDGRVSTSLESSLDTAPTRADRTVSSRASRRPVRLCVLLADPAGHGPFSSRSQPADLQ